MLLQPQRVKQIGKSQSQPWNLRGLGYLIPDVFVHLSEVMKAKLPHLRPDVAIAYTLEVEDGKKSAKELSSLSAGAISTSLSGLRDDPLTDFTDEFEKEWDYGKPEASLFFAGFPNLTIALTLSPAR